MNQVCKGFGNKLHNYSFYWAVRAFGQTAFSGEDVLDSSISQETHPKLAKL